MSASHFALGATIGWGRGIERPSLPLSGLLEAPHTHTNEQLALKEIKKTDLSCSGEKKILQRKRRSNTPVCLSP